MLYDTLKKRKDFDTIVRTLENEGFDWMNASAGECADAAEELLRIWGEEGYPVESMA